MTKPTIVDMTKTTPQPTRKADKKRKPRRWPAFVNRMVLKRGSQ